MSDATTLISVLSCEPPRADVISACGDLVDAEVKAKSGFGGAAIKAAYATVKKIKPKFVTDTIDALLDEWLAKMEPHHQEWRGAKGGSFADFIEARSDDVAEALLSVTDERAQTTKHKTAGKLYLRMRPKALANVSSAVPKLGALIETYL